MALKRIILEMGAGNDLYGEDYTKAACRAVQDALHHSSLSLFKPLGLDRDQMVITVTIGVQQPERIDCDAVAQQIPFGRVSVNAELGGLNVVDGVAKTTSVVAAVGIVVHLDLPDEPVTLA